jgi:short subunit dehydrogenase-like uncharacterized protein
MIDAHHATAVRTGARIVHSCGFDSVPADLGAFMVARHLQEALGAQADEISYQFGSFGLGGFSGKFQLPQHALHVLQQWCVI